MSFILGEKRYFEGWALEPSLFPSVLLLYITSSIPVPCIVAAPPRSLGPAWGLYVGYCYDHICIRSGCWCGLMMRCEVLSAEGFEQSPILWRACHVGWVQRRQSIETRLHSFAK